MLRKDLIARRQRVKYRQSSRFDRAKQNNVKKTLLRAFRDEEGVIRYREEPWTPRPSSSVLIIGNSPNVLDRELGYLIDKHPFVVRLNDFQTKGYEKFVGSKTDMWLTACSSRASNINKDSTVPVIGLISRQAREAKTPSFKKRTGRDIETFKFLKDSEFNYLKNAIGGKNPISTGLMAIFLFTDILKVKEVFIYGFDFFSSGEHYYGHDIDVPVGAGHCGVREREAVDKLVKSNRIKWLTSESALQFPKTLDISAVTSKTGKPRKHIFLFGNSTEINNVSPLDWEGKDVVTAGVNRIYKSFQPDYYFFMDGKVADDLMAEKVKRVENSKWIYPSFLFDNPDHQIERKNYIDYLQDQDALEVDTSKFTKYTKRKSSVIWLMLYLNNYVFKKYHCTFYLVGISLKSSSKDNYFYGDSVLNTGITYDDLQNQYNSQLKEIVRLVDVEKYDCVSLTPESKCNQYIPAVATDFSSFLRGMPDL